MPMMFALGLHDSLDKINRELRPDEHVFAFLDDVYVVAQPDRIHPIYDVLGAIVCRRTGIKPHAGKREFGIRMGFCQRA